MHGASKNFAPDVVFTGSSLTGWQPIGQSTWRAENGEIIGTPNGCRRRLAAGEPVLSGRRCLRVVSMRGGLPDGRDAARRADRRRRREGRLRVAERRGPRCVSRDAGSSGRSDIQRTAARAGRRTAARGVAAARSGAAGGCSRRAQAALRPFRRSRVESRRRFHVRTPACAAATGTRSRSCSTRTSFARFSTTLGGIGDSVAEPRVRRLRSVRAVCGRNRRSAVQGRVAQGSAAESGAARTGVEQVPDADAERVLLLVGSCRRRLQSRRHARHRRRALLLPRARTTRRLAKSTSAAPSIRERSTSTACSTPTTSRAMDGPTC